MRYLSVFFLLLLFQEQVGTTVRELLSVCLKSSPKVASPILDLFRLVFSRKRSQEQEQADNELCMEQLQGMLSNAHITYFFGIIISILTRRYKHWSADEFIPLLEWSSFKCRKGTFAFIQCFILV